MSELIFVDTTNNHNVVLCKGEPESITDDVQYYYFNCNHCKSGLKSQPQFMEFVKEGIDVMCGECAKKIGFSKLHHFNGNEKMIKGRYEE